MDVIECVASILSGSKEMQEDFRGREKSFLSVAIRVGFWDVFNKPSIENNRINEKGAALL